MVASRDTSQETTERIQVKKEAMSATQAVKMEGRERMGNVSERLKLLNWK